MLIIIIIITIIMMIIIIIIIIIKIIIIAEYFRIAEESTWTSGCMHQTQSLLNIELKRLK